MKPLFCQKGFAPIIVVIVIAVVAMGLIGSAIYPQVKPQIEKTIVPKEPDKTLEEKPQATERDTLKNDNQTEKITEATQNSQDSSQEETSDDQIAQTKTVVSEDEEGKAKGTGKKGEEEKGQKPEGIEDEPPVNVAFKVLDFAKIPKLVQLLPTLSSASIINNNVSRSTGKTSSPTPTPKPTPAPTPSNKAIVVTLDTVKIHDKTDPFSNGEVQIVTSTRTGSIEQVDAWPYKNWAEANNGATLKVNQPIFVYPKDSIDEKMAIWISVVENDSLPKSAPGLIKKATDISTGSNSVYQDPTIISKEDLYNQTIDKYTKWLGFEQHIGTLATVLYKSQNFGMGSEHKKTFIVKRKNTTITYTVREVPMPEKPLKVTITVLNAKPGFYGKYSSFLMSYIWTYVSDGFEGKEPHGLPKRIPEKNAWDISSGLGWSKKEVFSGKITGPIVYYEVGVWTDHNNLSNDDQWEIASDTLYMADYKAGDVITTSQDGTDGVNVSGTIKREIKFSASD